MSTWFLTLHLLSQQSSCPRCKLLQEGYIRYKQKQMFNCVDNYLTLKYLYKRYVTQKTSAQIKNNPKLEDCRFGSVWQILYWGLGRKADTGFSLVYCPSSATYLPALCCDVQLDFTPASIHNSWFLGHMLFPHPSATTGSTSENRFYYRVGNTSVLSKNKSHRIHSKIKCEIVAGGGAFFKKAFSL